ncbi:DUF3010 family protein [Moritella sp. F3]|uniref:DUF3010 family protein n=1 Tax=Moritella sp. F3 TaxID=2718882 RepID=UPI001A21E793|nr:DUF3010 family protein [Moritella sp. F3]GIC76385.1 hypothetical protein FMO001_11120 [Moritella sp. F1]GIC80946.1 hypothetical protein FMO003_12270 [Moritella sp. F3]
MRICSVELAGNEVNLCFLSLKDGMFELIECRKRKITLASSTEAYQIRQFHKEFAQLMTDYKIENVVIKERLTKGKFSGSSTSFKAEAAIQLVTGVEVSMVSQTFYKQLVQDHPIFVDFAETGLKKFQQNAFTLGCLFLNENAAKNSL